MTIESEKIRELQDVVDCLLHTRDRVVIVPGMRVFYESADPDSATKGNIVHSIELEERTDGDDFPGTVYTLDLQSPYGGPLPLPDECGFYSSPEALQAAKGTAENGDAT